MDTLYEEVEEPVSPTGQYFNNSVICSYVVAFMELANPFDESLAMPLVKDVFLPINPRFSSIMVRDQDGKMIWKKVEVYLEEHIKIPKFPDTKESLYDNYLNDYVKRILNARTPQDKPLWEIHFINYPTSKAANTVIFKLHHALGDGYSLMSALLSCLERFDDPSLPLSFPLKQQSNSKYKQKSLFEKICLNTSNFFYSILDFGLSTIKTRMIEDDITPIRSGYEGTELQPFTMSNISLSLDQIKGIKSKLGVTINDLVTGIIFYGIRLYMEEKNEKTKCSKSTSVVLLNTRNIGGYKSLKEMQKPEYKGVLWGNQFSLLQVPIPKLTQSRITNPLEFVWESRKLIERKRHSFGVYLTALLMDFERKLRGPEAVAKTIFKSSWNSSVVITNIVGPIEKAALANDPVNGIYFTVMGGPENLFISIISYVKILRITVRALKGFIDEHKLKFCIEKAAEVIFKSAMEISETPTTN